MKKLLFFVLLLVISCFAGSAQDRQVMIGPSQVWKYDPDLTEEQLYKYERLMNMSREDWDLFRKDPRYDSERVVAIYREHKKHIDWRKESLAEAKLLPGESCNCLVEPNVDYIWIDWLDEADPMMTTSTEAGVGGAGAGVDCYYGPINLPFDVCFFDETYSACYVTSKGTIAFGTPYIDWTPSEFPMPIGTGEPQYDHICGYWGDADYRNSGFTYFKVTDDELFVNWIDAGYYNNHADKTNTFQVIVTSENSEFFDGDTNVQICLQQMGWAHGDIGGGGGFNGPTPGNVGADRESGSNHVQIGRFNLNSTAYNGPYGENASQQDGVHWLDFKSFDLDLCGSTGNMAPLSTTSAPCDTLFVCLNDTLDLSTQFIAPEIGQMVQIVWEFDGTGLEANANSGNTASWNAVFVGSVDNIGTNEITVTATDNGNPNQQTIFNFIIEVLNIELPPLTIDGNLAVCAGGLTELTASEGYDIYEWSENGCFGQTCVAQGGGIVQVVAQLDECFSTTSVFIVEQAFSYADITVTPDPICPDQTSTVCIEFPEEYVSFQWSAYPGYCGDILPGQDLTAPCVEVGGDCESHLYVLATDSLGCVSFNIPVVHIIESNIDPINEQFEDFASCDGNLTPIEFTGGYTSPADGWLNLYLITGDPEGWYGSYLDISITPCDGELPWDTTVTSTQGFTLVAVPIEYCDEICIEYNSSGVGDSNNSIQIFNCINENPIEIGPGLENGNIWCGTSGCQASSLPGTWTVDGPDCWSLTDMDIYNNWPDPNVFEVTCCGLYTLTFTDPNCPSNDHVYEIEYNEVPTVEILNPFEEILLCDGSSTEVEIEFTDCAGNVEIDWDGNGVVPSNDGTSAEIGPYSNCANVTVNVQVENGCGTAEDEILISAQNEPANPTFDSETVFLCGGEDVLIDANVSGDCNFVYSWEDTNFTTQDITVDETGEYCLTVENDCGNSDEVCVDVTLVPIANDPLTSNYYLECQDGELEVCVNEFNVPANYIVTWFNNGNQIGTGECITLTSTSENYSVQVTDPFGCNTVATGNLNFTGVISTQPITSLGNADGEIVCPGQEIVLDLNPNTNVVVSWDADCGITLDAVNPVTFGTDMVPVECLGTSISITGTASNPCGSSSGTWVFVPDACSILIPNIITPNGDDLNQNFYIEGLENYTDVILRIYDRWGTEVHADDAYENDWGPSSLTEGTYYYTIKLPYGTQTEYEGYFMVVK